jgi:hypothetical protein
VFSVFQNSNPQSPNTKLVPNYLRHVLEKLGANLNRWTWFVMVLPRDAAGWHCKLADTTTPCTLPETPRLPHINDKAYIREQILHVYLAQIREDVRPIGFRTGAEETMPRARPRLTRPVHASPRARTGPRPPMHRTHAYKNNVALVVVGTCSLVQGDPTGVWSDVNRVFARDDNSSVNLASQGHCAGVFIGIQVPSVPC